MARLTFSASLTSEGAATGVEHHHNMRGSGGAPRTDKPMKDPRVRVVRSDRAALLLLLRCFCRRLGSTWCTTHRQANERPARLRRAVGPRCATLTLSSPPPQAQRALARISFPRDHPPPTRNQAMHMSCLRGMCQIARAFVLFFRRFFEFRFLAAAFNSHQGITLTCAA